MTTWTLGVDTSTDICLGLAADGSPVASDRVADRRGHAEKLMPAIIAMCERAGIAVSDITEVAVGVGPGPFTGLRVGIVTAHTIAAMAGTELHGVCSLDVMAKQWIEAGSAPNADFVIASDARRRELYWARYDASGMRIGDPRVSAPDVIGSAPLAGPGREVYPELFADAGGPTTLDAGLIARAWAELPDVGIEPLYLRKPDASVPTTRKSTLLQPRLQVGRR
ncbi:MAG TPA: tRNA (adenosine(37)-N6)-threonylcarbamoyltransferase complex dimerization subunit type 1 TsaB [Propionibacteriaceae bacterium]|nr:tRNA (adenosine(37)-N6)-threonylcarbamoyltransferase complex dimerization subunit type 1 TsaB [Propionibacteriaceae bacterium]